MESKRLYRSSVNIQIAGVCGGLAEYFDIDPILVRVLFILLVLFGGSGVLVYVILWLVVPRNPSVQSRPERSKPDMTDDGPDTGNDNPSTASGIPSTEVQTSRGGLIAGIILITLGALFLIDEWIPDIHFSQLWPVILIVIGGLLLAGATKRNKTN